MDADRPQVGEEPEAPAHGEERLLRADGRPRVVPRRAADGAEEDGVAGRAGGQVLVADGDAVRVDAGPAHHELAPGDLEAEPCRRRREDAPRGGDDVGADAVAGDRDEPEGRPAGRMVGARKAILRGHGSRSRRTAQGDDRPVQLGGPELVGGQHVRLQRGLDDVRREPVAGDDVGLGTLVGRAPAAQEDAALGVLALGDGLDLVLDERRLPAEDGPDRVVDRAVEGVDRAVPGVFAGSLLAVERDPDAPRGAAAVRRGDAPALDDDGGRDVAAALLDEGQEVRVGDLLLHVGQRDRLAVDEVQGVARDVVAEVAQLLLEALAAGQLADRQLAAGEPDRLRGHDLVGERVLDHAVLVDPALVGEGVGAHDGLVGLDREAGEVAHQAAGGRDLLGLHAAGQLGELGRARPEGHHDLLERGVAGALAEAVDRHLHLARAGLDGGERVGRGEAEVVVAVDGDRGVAPDEVDDRDPRAARTPPGWRSRRCPGCSRCWRRPRRPPRTPGGGTRGRCGTRPRRRTRSPRRGRAARGRSGPSGPPRRGRPRGTS